MHINVNTSVISDLWEHMENDLNLETYEFEVYNHKHIIIKFIYIPMKDIYEPMIKCKLFDTNKSLNEDNPSQIDSICREYFSLKYTIDKRYYFEDLDLFTQYIVKIYFDVVKTIKNIDN